MNENCMPCSNCNQLIAETKLVLHETYCIRYNIKCERCGQYYDKNDPESHEEDYHKKEKCQYCYLEFDDLSKHKCQKTPKQCLYCELSYPIDQIFQHENQCGSRTEKCLLCQNYIMKRDLSKHNNNCTQQIEVKEKQIQRKLSFQDKPLNQNNEIIEIDQKSKNQQKPQHVDILPQQVIIKKQVSQQQQLIGKLPSKELGSIQKQSLQHQVIQENKQKIQIGMDKQQMQNRPPSSNSLIGQRLKNNNKPSTSQNKLRIQRNNSNQKIVIPKGQVNHHEIQFEKIKLTNKPNKPNLPPLGKQIQNPKRNFESKNTTQEVRTQSLQQRQSKQSSQSRMIKKEQNEIEGLKFSDEELIQQRMIYEQLKQQKRDTNIQEQNSNFKEKVSIHHSEVGEQEDFDQFMSPEERNHIQFNKGSENKLSGDHHELRAYCKNPTHQNILQFWCKGCSKAMCQKCVVEHSLKQFRKIHQLVELSTLRSEVQKEATDLSQELDLLMQTLQPEYNLVEQQRIGLQLLQRSQTILLQAVTSFFDELKHTFISLTSNHSNLTQKKVLQEELEKIMFELNEYILTNDFQISEFFERDFRASIKKMRENVTQFIEKTKIEYKKPNLKINDKFTQDIPQLLSNYISITFEKNHMDKTEIRAPKPRQTLHFTMERNNSQRLERKMTLINPQNLAQSQILNHTYLQAITEQNLEDQLIQQFDQNEEIQKIVILEQSRIRYLHSLIDSQTLFIHDIQLKENQLISLPESAKIPDNAQTLLTSDLILYICGGIHNQNLSQKFYQFDNVHGLLQLPNLLEPINHHSLIYIKGFIYIIGGKTQERVTAKCWRFIINTQVWEEFANLNEPRSHHSSCVFENEDQTFIYTFFGQGQGGILLDSIEKYSNLERRWQSILVKNMIPGIATIRCGCIQLDEQRILIYGGYYKNVKNANKMITFNTYTATIDNLNQLNQPIGQLQGQPITINNSIYSLHNCPDQIVPKYSEFGDVLYILEINSNSCHIQDVINCRQLTLKKN